MKSFIDPNLLDRLRVGVLAPYFDQYLQRIQQLGFLPSSVPMQMYAITRFSKWLHKHSIDLRQLDEAIVDQFLKRDADLVHTAEPAPLRRVLAMLREMEVTPAKPSEPSNGQQSCIEAYRGYLVQERGLAENTIPHYVAFAEQLLSSRFGVAALNLSGLDPTYVATFMRERASQLSPGRCKLMVTALRSFLRYLQHAGEIRVNLAGCVPPVAAWSLSSVPKFLPRGTVQRCSSGVSVKRRKESATTLFCCCSHGWGCAPARSLR
jgi:hypothetical protein